MNKNRLSAALSAVILSLQGVANAESWALEEVVVTAQKRAESAQDVPVAISAFSEEMVTNTGADGVGDIIAMVPGLSGSSATGGTLNFWAIRGVASNDFTVGAEPSVGTYIDDAYIGRNVHALSAFFDVSRVEVVKGPQGTLFGRNAAAGAISIVTNAPELENSGKVGISVGNEGQREYDAVGNWAVSDDLAIRLAYHGTRLDGVQEDVGSGDNGGYDNEAIRLSALWAVSDSLEARLTLNYAESSATVINGSYTPDFQVRDDEFPDKIALSSPAEEKIYSNGANLRLTWDMNDALTLTSITDYRSFDMEYQTDIDGTADDYAVGGVLGFSGIPTSVQFEQPQVLQESFSQEFRLNGSHGDLDWFVGASYFKERVDETQRFTLLDTAEDPNLGLVNVFGVPGNLVDLASGDGSAQSLGLYGDIKYAVSERLSLTAGLRWSEDEKDWCSTGTNSTTFLGVVSSDNDLDGTPNNICGSETWSEITRRFVVDYALTDDILLYASYSEGYKGGGFNIPGASRVAANDLILGPAGPTGSTLADRAPNVAAGEYVFFTAEDVSSFEPETSTSYEAGMKSSFLDGRLQLNMAAFHVKFENLQIQNATVTGVITSNAAKAESQGVELDFVYAATDNLVIMGNYTHLDADYQSGVWAPDQSPLRGRNLAFAPENTYSISAAYDVSLETGSLSLFTSYNWTGEYHNQSTNEPLLEQDEFGLWNAKLTYRPDSDTWDAFIAIDNIEDKGYSTWKQDLGFNLGANVYRGMPRLWKVGFNAYFD